MKDVFISTPNYQEFEAMCNDLIGSRVGLDMAAVTGRAGRGKTTAAERYVTMNSHAIYVRFQEWLSHVGLLREIAFEISGSRPRSTQCRNAVPHLQGFKCHE